MGEADGPAPASDDALCAAALLEIPGLGASTLTRLVAAFGSPRQVWEAPVRRWQQAVALPAPVAKAARELSRDKHLCDLGRRLRACAARVVTVWEPGYPANLRFMPDPPPVLFVKGSLVAQDQLAVAIVGSRRASPEGLMAARRMALELASRGFTVVSGLAAGVDASAHRGALAAGGRTLGVLGCGPDRVYPPEHGELYAEVAASGALITPYPPGTGPAAWQFAARNRLIAGLCAAVLVVEARERSGALSTAQEALNLSREVLATPGSVELASCRGSNRLLRDGALVCLEPDDVAVAALELLARWRVDVGALVGGNPSRVGPTGPRGRARPAPGGLTARPAQGEPAGRLSPEARRLLGAMDDRARAVEELCAASGLGVGTVLAHLTELEAAGLLTRLGDGRFARRGSALFGTGAGAYNKGRL